MLKNGYIRMFGIFWKFARIGERLSPYVSICCVLMAVSYPTTVYMSSSYVNPPILNSYTGLHLLRQLIASHTLTSFRFTFTSQSQRK